MRTGVRAVAAVAVLTLGLDLAAAAAWGTADPSHYAWETANALVWVATGLAAVRIRPESRIGLLMAAFGLLLAANSTASFGLVAGAGPAVLQTLAYSLVAPQPPLVGHAMLAYPDGRLPDRSSRLLLAVSYPFALLDMLRVLLATGAPPLARRCADHCANNPWQLVQGDLADRLAFAAEAGWLVLGAAFVLVLGARLFRSSPRERRVQIVPLAGAFATALAFVLLGAAGSTAGAAGGNDARTQVLQAATVLGVPVAFLVGLLRERLSHAQVADLVRVLERAPLEELGARVARALGDPSAQVIFPLAGGYVDPAGRPAVLPAAASARRVTPLGDGDSPLALLVHDRQLEREPSLLAAAGAATRLTVENARLHAKVRAQLTEVRASRARLVSAGDAERRRLERDLHDGAQQRLLTLGVLLRLLANQLHDDPDAELTASAELIREAQAELSAAVDELRQLARGIHPAVLTDLGLPAAVQQLAERSTLPIAVTARLNRRLAADVEATAYFVVSEGIANAVKYADATEVRVTISPSGAGLLRITVADDGVGGADPAAGSGLHGLADRVASIDGTLSVHSPRGGGTELTASLPLR